MTKRDRAGHTDVTRRTILKGTGAAALSLAPSFAFLEHLQRPTTDVSAVAASRLAASHSVLRTLKREGGGWGVSAFGGYPNETAGIANWQSITGRRVTATRVYNQPGSIPVYSSRRDFQQKQSLMAAFQLGLTAVVSYRPAYSGTTGPDNLPSPAQMQADQTAMVESLQSIIASGFPAENLRVSIWHEARSHGVSAAQYLNLYAGVASGGLSNYAALHAICPVYHIDLGNLSAGAPGILGYFPGPPTLPANHMDGVCVDWYGGAHVNGRTLDPWLALADGASPPVGFGITEYGNSAGKTLPTVAQMAQFLLSSSITIEGTTYPGDPVNSIQSVFQTRQQAGKVNLELIWFQNQGTPGGANVIASASDPRIPMLQQLHDSLF